MIFLNAERFIAEAIESALAQDYGDLELILVDDGSARPALRSPGPTRSDCARFVRYVQHEGGKNRGMSASRNLGLSHARGEFVAFLDADDVWAHHKLREQPAIIEAHPDVDMVCGAVRYWRSWAGGDDVMIPSGGVPARVVAPPETTLKLYPLGTAAAPCPSDLLMRRTAVAALGGFEEHFTGAKQMYEDRGFPRSLSLLTGLLFESGLVELPATRRLVRRGRDSQRAVPRGQALLSGLVRRLSGEPAASLAPRQSRAVSGELALRPSAAVSRSGLGSDDSETCRTSATRARQPSAAGALSHDRPSGAALSGQRLDPCVQRTGYLAADTAVGGATELRRLRGDRGRRWIARRYGADRRRFRGQGRAVSPGAAGECGGCGRT